MQNAPERVKDKVSQHFDGHADFVTSSVVLLKQTVVVCYLESLVDYKQTQETLNLIASRYHDTYAPLAAILLPLKGSLNQDSDSLTEDLLNGKMVDSFRKTDPRISPSIRRILRSNAVLPSPKRKMCFNRPSMRLPRTCRRTSDLFVSSLKTRIWSLKPFPSEKKTLAL